jgi:hypothetical protein
MTTVLPACTGYLSFSNPARFCRCCAAGLKTRMIGIRSRVAKKLDEEFASPPERADATIPVPTRYAADAECIASRITDAHKHAMAAGNASDLIGSTLLARHPSDAERA